MDTNPQTQSRFALTRGQPIPAAIPTGYPVVDLLAAAGYVIDQKRLDRVFNDPRGRPVHGNVGVTATPQEIIGVVKGTYHTRITLQPQVECDCDCPDWFQSGGKATRTPCKHILGTAVDAPWPVSAPLAAPTPAAAAASPSAPPPAATADEPALSFAEQVQRRIGQAVGRLADQIEAILAQDRVPFLIGPTDVAKTSAVRLVAVRNGWAFEAVDGMSSFSDADLVGLRTDHICAPGVIARAFSRARAGETVLALFDECTRFNQRALDVLMRPLLPIPAEVAWAQHIPADDGQPVRMVEAPLWGVDWAPVSRCKLALACNPWGAALDPALVRRVVPVEVTFDPAVAALFQKPARDAIETSWKLVTEGQLPLPIGYTLLSGADDPTDLVFLDIYCAQLRAVDRPAAEGFRKVLEGMGLKLGGRP
jgi:hypothetical protein